MRMIAEAEISKVYCSCHSMPCLIACYKLMGKTEKTSRERLRSKGLQCWRMPFGKKLISSLKQTCAMISKA